MFFNLFYMYWIFNKVVCTSFVDFFSVPKKHTRDEIMTVHDNNNRHDNRWYN